MRTGLRSIAWLVHNGLTLAEVDEMSEAEIIAWAVCFGEAQGSKWSWSRMRWEDQS